jgi:predicted transposase/invertase (TIGR01784 family)
MNLVSEIKQAFEIANEVNLTPEQIEDMEMQEMFIHDQRNAIKKALNQGRQEGLEEGRQKGVDEGKLSAKLEIARNLLDVLDDAAISRVSGLSLGEIAKLRET